LFAIMSRFSIRAVSELSLGVALVALVMHTWFLMGLVIPVTVAGQSMEPTLVEPRRLVVDRTAFALREPRRWEVVVFRSPQDADQLCVKRVVGLPGETVGMVDGRITINGRKIDMPPGLEFEPRYGDTADPQTGWQLGPYEYFVLGDNAAISDDSRNWPAGPGLDARLLLGRPLNVR
jgi:signal peptidase I